MDETEEVDFDEEAWEREQERIRQEKKKKYEGCLSFILETLIIRKSVTLSDLKEITDKEPEERNRLIPDLNVFKEVMVELLKSGELDIDKLRQERSMNLTGADETFEPNVMILDLLDRLKGGRDISHISISKYGKGKVIFENIVDTSGILKAVRCSEICIRIEN